MKKFIKYLLTIFIMAIILFEGVVCGIICQKKGVFQSSYQNLIVDKYRILQKTDEKKIIMVAGSSTAFGLDQDMLEEKTGYKVANLGLHAGFGPLFYSELAKENINSGDIVLLGYEYKWICGFESLDQNLVMTGIDDNIDMYKHIPIQQWPDFIGYLFQFAEAKNTYAGASGQYSREAFDSESGQMTWSRDYAMSVSTYGTISVEDAEGNVYISNKSVEYLKEFKEYVESKGATVYFVSPPILYDSITCDINNFLKLAELEEEEIGIPYISDPRLYMFPSDLMSNDVYHCNSEGEKVRTNILIEDLIQYGVIEGETRSDVLKDNVGETVALVDTLPKKLLHKPENIKKVYSIINGEYRIYEENADYVIDYERGTIRRTENSQIPNYGAHSVIFSEGKFTWNNDPDNYNPESNESYQIRVDYDYYVCSEELNSIEDNSGYLSEKTKNKILSGEDIFIELCGDPIGAGANTDGEGIFINYLGTAIEEYYNINVNTKNISIGGCCRDLLVENMDSIIADYPDIMIIEFGINDHCAGVDNVSSYIRDIENSVFILKENGIDVILMGFFQQNTTWDQENREATVLYNQALEEVAERNGVYYADVYNLFEKLGIKKHLSNDVMADYIHHPTEWGHKLYFTSLLSAFNIDGNMRPVDFVNYISAE